VPVLTPPASRRRRLLLGAAASLGAATLAAGCSSLAFTVANLPARSGRFRRQAGIAYGPEAGQGLDVYAPTGAAGAPVIVFWYGGAWVKGSKDDYRFVGATLAGLGYVAVLADYRLYPAVRFPQFVQDGALAVKWAADHAREHGGDPRRLFVAGHSAGAHLAAMLAVQPRWLQAAGVDPGAVRGLIGLSGPYALEPNSAELNAIFAAPFTSADWQPAAQVTRSAPPALLLHGGDDDVVWPGQAETLAAALRAAGVPVELEIYPGRGHADIVAALSEPGRSRAPVRQAITRFVSARSDPSR
jgi:acetyl esterase/lipase